MAAVVNGGKEPTQPGSVANGTRDSDLTEGTLRSVSDSSLCRPALKTTDSSSDSLTANSVFSIAGEETGDNTPSPSARQPRPRIVKPVCGRQHSHIKDTDGRRRLHSSPDCSNNASPKRHGRDPHNRSRASSLTNSPCLPRRSARSGSQRDRSKESLCTIHMQQANPPSLSPRENKVSKRRKELAHSFHCKPHGVGEENAQQDHTHHSPCKHQATPRKQESATELRKKDQTIRELKRELKEMQRLLDEKNNSLLGSDVQGPEPDSAIAQQDTETDGAAKKQDTDTDGAAKQQDIETDGAATQQDTNDLHRKSLQGSSVPNTSPMTFTVYHENIIQVKNLGHDSDVLNDSRPGAGTSEANKPTVDSVMCLPEQTGIVNEDLKVDEAESALSDRLTQHSGLHTSAEGRQLGGSGDGQQSDEDGNRGHIVEEIRLEPSSADVADGSNSLDMATTEGKHSVGELSTNIEKTQHEDISRHTNEAEEVLCEADAEVASPLSVKQRNSTLAKTATDATTEAETNTPGTETFNHSPSHKEALDLNDTSAGQCRAESTSMLAEEKAVQPCGCPSSTQADIVTAFTALPAQDEVDEAIPTIHTADKVSVDSLQVSLKTLQKKYEEVLEDCQRNIELADQYRKETLALKEELDVREEDHKQMYLQMYLKGQQMAMFERQQEIEELASENPNNVMVQELLDKLNNIQGQLAHWQTLRRTEFYQLGERAQTQDEATLHFLKDALFHYLTDQKDSEQHLRAMTGIVGFTEHELKKIATAQRKDKGGKKRK